MRTAANYAPVCYCIYLEPDIIMFRYCWHVILPPHDTRTAYGVETKLRFGAEPELRHHSFVAF